MNPGTRLSVELATAAVAVLAVWICVRLQGWRKKDSEEIERLRRLAVNHRGRIAGGRILDLLEPEPQRPARRTVVYVYEVAGVKYEASQDVSALQSVAAAAPRLLGQPVSVKYDQKNPMNSIIACEEWSGVPRVKPAPGPATKDSKNPSEALKTE